MLFVRNIHIKCLRPSNNSHTVKELKGFFFRSAPFVVEFVGIEHGNVERMKINV